jgi:4-amino-4-deoxy-L-arabinose transferase-like glycosyltransferase
MPHVLNKPIPIPLPIAGTIVLAVIYCALGLAGHSPWKTEDAIGVGIVHEMLTGSGRAHWLVPHLAGEPYLADGPLFYWLSTVCARIFSFAMPIHDAARIASALFLGLTIWFSRLAAIEFFGRQEGDSTALMLIGCLGLFVHAHMVDGENAALTGSALAWYGLALIARGKSSGTRYLGGGIAVIFWAKGLAPSVPLIIAMLSAPLLSESCRSRRFVIATAMSALLACLALLAWVFALGSMVPGSINSWWNMQWESLSVPDYDRIREQMQLLSWATWPLWPIAIWTVWDRRRRLKADPCLIAAAGTLAAFALFIANSNVSEILAEPMMIPLAILAGAGFTSLRRGAANAISWFGAITFSLLGGLVWLGWLAMMTGAPAQVAANFAKLEPGHVPRFDAMEFMVAIVLTAAWLALLLRGSRSPLKGAPVWACGVTLVWGLVMSLWVHWIDYGKTYQPMAQSLKAAVPGTGCIASRNLGEAQRAAIHYHAGIVTKRLETHTGERCNTLLIQGVASRPDRVGAEWRQIWQGSRPRERERFRLYVRG